ncbi:CPBP family intramembrane glutamic endopeptidase [Agrococcus casei]|uniref:Putative integral membrane protein n=1 Tax=Agrococcus casei LMG 22410 TaxID=1255656 RepID=A0A1R4EY89_9MICO|nr:type II CAAX endopeptidase family protein [Agrococcus casei]SJM48604.1 putative integral membrane protein [Agrococcus casei LMG 22410]
MRNAASGLTELPLTTGPARTRLKLEMVAVAFVSLGASAVWSIVQILDALTRESKLNEQQIALNPSRSDREWLDFLNQTVGHVLAFAPVLLVCVLLWQASKPHLGQIGIDGRRPGKDALLALGMAALIGVPGIAFYFVAVGLGINRVIDPGSGSPYWWSTIVLLLAAARAAFVEEFIVLGYWFERMRRLGVSPMVTIVSASVLRGSYHLYQGFGGFIGNIVMGLVWGWVYQRTGRLWPFVVAHFLMDALVFIGYPLVAHLLSV